MEDVLELYHEPYDPRRPVVCFDEGTKQLIGETRLPLPRRPGEPMRYDYEYERLGTCNLFMFFEPLRSWRHVDVTDRRTMIDFAHCMKDLVDTWYPDAECIRVVQDNLNTHKPASLYEAFAPQESTTYSGTPGVSLHAQTWQLAEYGRNRTKCSQRPVPGSPHCSPTDPKHRSSAGSLNAMHGLPL